MFSNIEKGLLDFTHRVIVKLFQKKGDAHNKEEDASELEKEALERQGGHNKCDTEQRNERCGKKRATGGAAYP